MIRRRIPGSGRLLFPAIVANFFLPVLAYAAAADVPVQGVLKGAQGAGVQIIYSTDLVPLGLTAPASRPDATPLQRAAEALASNGLALRPVGIGKYVVVKADKVQLAGIAARPEPVLDEVTVYASRYAMDGSALYDGKLQTQSDIQSIPGTHDDPLRALRALPGLATSVSSRPYIRGSLADDVLVRYDGVVLIDPFHLKNFQSLYGAIDPMAVESMEVYSGGFPVRYGTRSGGVIDITPPTRRDGNDIALTLSQMSMGAAVSGKSTRWPVDWLVTLRRNTTNLLLEPLDVERGEPKVFDATGLLHWAMSDSTDWNAGWLLLDDRIEIGTAGEEEAARARYRDEYGWLTFRHRFGVPWQSRTTLAVAAAERLRDGLVQRPSVSTGQVAESRDYNKIELTSDWTYEPGTGTGAALGTAIATTEAEYSYQRQLELDPGMATAFGKPVSGDLAGSGQPSATTFSAYGSLRRSWSRAEAELGVRLDGQAYAGDQTHLQWSPRANLRYDLNDRWRVYGSLGRFTQAQAVEEWRTEELQQRADPVQAALHAVAGFAHENGAGTRWSLEVYLKRWTTASPYFESQLDPLALLPDLLPDRVRIAPDNSEASGAEFSIRTQFSDDLQGWGSIAVARVADEFMDSDQVRSWDQPMAVNTGMAWSHGSTSLSVMAAWHSGWPRTPVEAMSQSAGTLDVGSRNAGRWNDFLTLDARGAWTHSALGGDLTAFVEITNTTDRLNLCCSILRPPAPGTTTPQIVQESWLPMIVNLGVTIHWRTRP